MKQSNPFSGLLLVLLIGLALPIDAQNQAIGLKLGLANYQGDLVLKQVNVAESRLAGGFFFRRNLNDLFSVRVAADFASISGDDNNYSERKGRGLSFKSNILAASINGQWNILGKSRFDNNGEFSKNFTPVIFSGLGAVIYDPKVKGLEAFNPDAPELAKTGQQYDFFIPFGVGGQYELTPKMTLGLEATTHLPFTDMLDGVSESGRSGNNDWFGTVTLTLQYWLDSPDKMKKQPGDMPSE